MTTFFSQIVSSKKQKAILYEYPSVIQNLKKHRAIHKSKVLSLSIDLNKPAWVSVNPAPKIDDNENSYRLCLGFKNIGCAYRDKDEKGLGCLNCGYYANTAFKEVDSLTLIHQFNAAILTGKETNTKFNSIEFLNDGSFFNADEINIELQFKLFHLISQMPEIIRVLVETRPEFIDMENVKKLLNILRDDQIFEIGMGLESADDFIREICINKGYSKLDFENAIKTLSNIKSVNKGISIVTYLLVKPAFLTDKECIDDIIFSINYLHELSIKYGVKITPKLEPAAIVDGTILSMLYEHDVSHFHYKPLSYWTLLEIIARLALSDIKTMLDLLRIGAREDMDDIIKAPAIYSDTEDIYYPFDFVIYESIQKFNQHHNVYRLFSVISEVYKRSNGINLSEDDSLKKWIRENNIKDIKIIELINNLDNFKAKENENIDYESEIELIMMIYNILDIMEGYNRKYLRLKREIDAAVLSNSNDLLEKSIENCFTKLFPISRSHVNVQVNTISIEDKLVDIFFNIKYLDSTTSIWSKFSLKDNNN